MEDEAAPPRAFDGHHFTDEDDVIAGRVPRVMAALQPRDAAVDQRRIGPAEAVRNAWTQVGEPGAL